MYPEGSNARDGGPSLNGLILLSLVVHFIVLSIFVFSPSLLPTRKLTFGPVYSVQLVSMPASSFERKGGETRAAKDLLNYVPAQQPLLNKTALDNHSVPIVPIEVRKKSSDNVEKALEAIRKNIPPPTERPASSPAAQLAAKMASGQAASSPVARSGDAGEVNARMKIYYTTIWARIKGLWNMPQSILPRENIEAVVHAQILRDGTITNVGLEKRSGNRYFDDSALRTVKKANPLPPLPDEIRDSSIEIGIRFHSAEFK